MISGRKSGILLHISSLPSDFGIGDLGPGAYGFVDFLQEANQCYWQILPINPTDTISEHSPYSSSSAFAGNILLISPQFLVDDRLLDHDCLELDFKSSLTTVNFDAVVEYKTDLLKRAYKRFLSDPHARQNYEKQFQVFCVRNAYWLDDYTFFVTIKDHFNGEIWTSWPDALRGRNKAALDEFADGHRFEIDEVKFLQYLFFKQWEKLRNYSHAHDVCIIGDVAIYMNLDSSDVWAYPYNYKLDKNFHPIAVAGVPPDFFSDSGQRWGNPVYDWKTLKSNKFSWWRERFNFNFQLFDLIRIDHFRGLVQYWEIPNYEQTVVRGRWMDVPTTEFFKTLETNYTTPLPIFAEDLGYITDDVRDVMRQFGFPGMKVLLFAFDGDMETHPYLPHNFNGHCVVYTGTHDNNTVCGWFKDDASQKEKRNMVRYLNRENCTDNIHWDFVRMAFCSDAELAIVPLQDILGLGSEARMNKPATTSGNWRWRVCKETLNSDIIQKLSDLTADSKRN